MLRYNNKTSDRGDWESCLSFYLIPYALPAPTPLHHSKHSKIGIMLMHDIREYAMRYFCWFQGSIDIIFCKIKTERKDL